MKEPVKPTLITDFESGYSFDALHSHSGRGALRVKAGVHSLDLRLIYQKGSSVSIEAYGHFATLSGTLTGKQWADMTVITAGTRLPGTVIAGEVSKVVSTANPVPALVTAAVTAGKYYHSQKVPDAAMQVSYFTNENKLVHSEYIGLTGKGRNKWQSLISQYEAKEDGYAQVSFLNSSPKITYFDDLTATGIDKVERESLQSNQLASVKTVIPVKVKNGVSAKETIGVDSSNVISDGAVPNGVPQEPIDGGELPPVVVTPDDGSPGPAVPTTPTNPTIPFPIIPGSGGSGGGGSGGGGSTPGTSPNPGLPANPVVNQVYTISKPDGTKVKYQYVCTGASCVWKIVEVSLPQATVIANSNNYNWLPRIPTNGVTILTPAGDFAYTYSTATSSWTGKPVPASVAPKTITNTMKNPCHKVVIDNINNTTFTGIMNSVFKTFSSTKTVNVTIGDFTNSDKGLDGKTEVGINNTGMRFPSDGGAEKVFTNPVESIDVYIYMNTTALSSASNEYIAATYYHEMVHAFINTYLFLGPNAQHDLMNCSWVEPMADALVQTFPTMDPWEAKAIVLGGLETYKDDVTKLNIVRESYKNAVDQIFATNPTYKNFNDRNVYITSVSKQYKAGTKGSKCP
ncbi:hypothetical protein QNI19_35540 [Cytophagaceae bacterium DM2B3-1]|uniref:Uncharacterized protein n=1 Tax=Xanthocytophaga flava TaxID=3048013 RepID=A0ABT7CX09_9BACT|nr:hypothetical protein [Xanthocytophaga flavus]